MYYDLFGQPLAVTYSGSALAFSNSLSNPPNVLTSLNAPRFTGFYNLPTQYLPPPPAVESSRKVPNGEPSRLGPASVSTVMCPLVTAWPSPRVAGRNVTSQPI